MMHDSGPKCCSVHGISYVLVLVGALNWGLVGIGSMTSVNLNVVDLLLGSWPMAEQAIYIIVGLAALVMLFKSHCKACRE